MIKKAALIGLLVITAVFAAAEEKKQDVLKDRPPVIESLEISPNPVGSGDLFTLTIIVDHDNSAEVDFPLEDAPEDILLWRGPYIRSFIDEDKDGNSRRKVRITTTFKALHSGRVIIPALRVLVENKELMTDPSLLRVGLYKNRKLYMPLETEWRAGFEKIYAGEAVPLSLVVKNQEVVVIFDRVRVASPRDGFFEKAGGISGITTRTEGDIVLYDIPAATYMLTSPVAGEIRIPSAGVDYEGVTGWTDNLYLEINRIPPEIQESGAIGSFMYDASLDRSRVTAGDNIILDISLEGSGNLNFLKLPEPETDGLIIVSSETRDDFKADPAGFSGIKSVSWNYTVESPGSYVVTVPEFTYLDKASEQVRTLRGRSFSVEVSEGVDEAEENITEVFPYTKVSNVSIDGIWKDYYKSYFMYAWMLPGLIFFIMVALMKGKRLILAGILSLIILIAVYSTGRFVINTSPDEQAVESSGMLYNQAIDAYSAGETAECMHKLRSAIYYNPVNSLYRETLDWVETENGFVNSVSPSIKLHPDIFYFILIFSINLFFLALVLRIIRPGGGVSVLIILFSFLILFSVGMIFYSHHSRTGITAVVYAEGSNLKKIPRDTAEDWVPLVSGTALKVLDDSGSFLLVETGLGIKGWMSESRIILDR